MHSPETLAFEIKYPFKNKNGYRNPIISVWHIDKCKDGTDDSCGWFIRMRHADKEIYEKIVKEFEHEWDTIFTSEDRVYNSGWFTPEGDNLLSVQGIVFNMYLYASKIVFNPYDKIDPRKAWSKAWKFMNKHHLEITYFAENNRDSMRDTIVRKYQRAFREEYTPENRMQMIRECAAIVYTDVLRKIRPWYRHPRWHIHHWKIQFHPFQNLKRRYWDKCCKCGKRGFKGSAIGDWNGTKIWHQHCDDSAKNLPTEIKQQTCTT